MESAFYLCYGPLPSIFLRMPSSTIKAPASTKLHGGFNHSFISVCSGFSHRRRCHHFYITGPLALDRSTSMTSGNEKGGGKVVRGAVGASLALACALSIIGFSCKMNFKAIACPKASGKMALKSLLDVTVNLASKEERKYWVLPRNLQFLSKETDGPKDEIDKLKEEAVSLMKDGKPDEAVSKLQNELEKYKKSDPESEFKVAMALVEILICQGEYDKALGFLRDDYEQISKLELRPTLYKAMLFTMLDKDQHEAENLWTKFGKCSGAILPKMG